MPEAMAPELTIRYSCGKDRLVDQRPHARGVDASAGRDQTGSDFDDEAHVSF